MDQISYFLITETTYNNIQHTLSLKHFTTAMSLRSVTLSFPITLSRYEQRSYL